MKLAFIFPGQGDQYCGMGKGFAETYRIAKDTFDEADEILGRSLSSVTFGDSKEELTKTANSQPAIFVASIAILRALEEQFPALKPSICSGLSLGEYSALCATKRLSFADTLLIVAARGSYMQEACEAHKGTMAAVIGLDEPTIVDVVNGLNLPNDLWIANYNSPGQVVISGTEKGVALGAEKAKEAGARKVMSLSVHGAFHSGLMSAARDRLASVVEGTVLDSSEIGFVMNVPGDFVTDAQEIQHNLVEQVVAPVRWEQGIRAIDQHGVDAYIKIGPGKSLPGLNRRIGVSAPTYNVESPEDLDALVSALGVQV